MYKMRLITLIDQVYFYRCELWSHISSLRLSEPDIYKVRLVTLFDQVYCYRSVSYGAIYPHKVLVSLTCTR